MDTETRERTGEGGREGMGRVHGGDGRGGREEEENAATRTLTEKEHLGGCRAKTQGGKDREGQDREMGKEQMRRVLLTEAIFASKTEPAVRRKRTVLHLTLPLQRYPHTQEQGEQSLFSGSLLAFLAEEV